MGEPVVILGESLVQAVVEVLVVGEDDMATNVVQLGDSRCQRNDSMRDFQNARWRLTKPSGVVSVPARPPALSEESTINHEGPFWREY